MSKQIKFIIKGQIPSGKNAVGITQKGRRFPNKRFTTWRKDAMGQLQLQDVPKLLIDIPVHVTLNYYSGDKRRRDAPGMMDAVWHLLEKYELVADDRWFGENGTSILWVHGGLDRENPRIEIRLDQTELRETL